MKRVEAIYLGRVQGIGFRFMAIRLAEQFGISGWVKNLANGGVQVVAEGESAILNRFLKSLEDRMSGYIQNKNLSWSESKNEFKGFSIKY